MTIVNYTNYQQENNRRLKLASIQLQLKFNEAKSKG